MPGDPKELLDRIARLARQLPVATIEALAAAIEHQPTVGAAVDRLRVETSAFQPSTQSALKKLATAWRSVGDAVPPVAIALALRTSANVDAWHREDQRLELVWTGPSAANTTLRRSDQALLEIIREAQTEILIVTFAAYRVPALRVALLDAVNRGVSFKLIAEHGESEGGKVKQSPTMALGSELAKRTAVYVWPTERRPVDDYGQRAALHAKCAVVDGRRLLVSSANFTGAAMDRNMELGILVEGGTLPKMVAEHFGGLVASGEVVRA